MRVCKERACTSMRGVHPLYIRFGLTQVRYSCSTPSPPSFLFFCLVAWLTCRSYLSFNLGSGRRRRREPAPTFLSDRCPGCCRIGSSWHVSTPTTCTQFSLHFLHITAAVLIAAMWSLLGLTLVGVANTARADNVHGDVVVYGASAAGCVAAIAASRSGKLPVRQRMRVPQ